MRCVHWSWVMISVFSVVVNSSFVLFRRMLSPFSSMRWALYMMRSRMASAMVAGAQALDGGPTRMAQGASGHGPGHVRHPRRRVHPQPELSCACRWKKTCALTSSHEAGNLRNPHQAGGLDSSAASKFPILALLTILKRGLCSENFAISSSSRPESVIMRSIEPMGTVR